MVRMKTLIAVSYTHLDADRLDTERFMDVESWRKRGNSATLADLLPQLEAYMPVSYTHLT